MPTRRATLCAEAGKDSAETVLLQAWLDRWRDRLPSCSENRGCGCCVDMFDVEAPQEALDELPARLFAASEWSGDVAPSAPGLRERLRRVAGRSGE